MRTDTTQKRRAIVVRTRSQSDFRSADDAVILVRNRARGHMFNSSPGFVGCGLNLRMIHARTAIGRIDAG
jgi:hypothetical protein